MYLNCRDALLKLSHKILWFFFGGFFLLLGIIGIVLPLLPTTPFVLLASACFMRASPKIHLWLISHRYLGPPIVEWQSKKTINKKIKKKAVIMIVGSFVLSICIAPVIWVKGIIAVIGIALLIWFSKIPSS